MGMVDSHYRFVWGSCGYPGNSHDAVIFGSTDLWSSTQDGFIPLIGKTVGVVTVPPLIVGDCISSSNMVNETVHQWCFNTPTALLQLPFE